MASQIYIPVIGQEQITYWKAIQYGVQRAVADSGVDSPIVKTTVATDNYGAGELAAVKLAELIGEKSKVGIVVTDQAGRSLIDRRDGFINTLRAKYPNIEVLPVQETSGIDMTKQLVKTLITENPDVSGMFGVTADTAVGISDAVKALNKTEQIKVVGFDPKIKAMIYQ